MKFTCNQQVLSKALNTVSKAVSNRATIPVLKGILLNASEDGKLTISASDLDISIETNIDVNVIDSGSIVVMAKLFGEIIRKLSNEDVTIEVEDEEKVSIKTISSEFKIVGQPADDFPNISEIEDVITQFSINSDMLSNMIRKTYFCTSIDESKGVMTGILTEIDENNITMASLDGFRMAIVKDEMENSNNGNIIISGRIMNEINKILSENVDDGNVKIVIGGKKAAILLERTRIVVRLLEGQFINYKDILPKENKIKVKVGKDILQESIERASLLAKEGKNNLVKYTIKENLLTITSASEEGAVKEEIIIEKEGEDIEIGFNSKYFLDALKAIDDDEITMLMNTSLTPCTIMPLQGENYLYLILPVRIVTG